MPYIGTGPEHGKTVSFDHAPEYVLELCGLSVTDQTEETQDALQALEAWYFSGNWIEEEENHEAAGF